MSVDPTKLQFDSLLATDRILGTYTGTINSPAPAAIAFTKTSTSTTITTNIPERTFFQGIFSIDGGVTWLDFNSQIPNITVPSRPALQTQMLYGYSLEGSLVITADNWSYYNGTTTTSASYLFVYKVALFARPNQGDITAQPVVQPLNFNTKYNYQKISRDSVGSVTIPTTTATITITHNLGYIPKIRHYVDNFIYSGLGGNNLYDLGYFASQFVGINVYIDTTTVYYFIDNSYVGSVPITTTFYTRIYYDS